MGTSGEAHHRASGADSHPWIEIIALRGHRQFKTVLPMVGLGPVYWLRLLSPGCSPRDKDCRQLWTEE